MKKNLYIDYYKLSSYIGTCIQFFCRRGGGVVHFFQLYMGGEGLRGAHSVLCSEGGYNFFHSRRAKQSATVVA